MLVSQSVSQAIADVQAAIAAVRGDATAGVISAAVANGGSGYARGDLVSIANAVMLQVDSVAGSTITSVSIACRGLATAIPANPAPAISTSGLGTAALFNLTWSNTASGAARRLENLSQFALAPIVTAINSALAVFDSEAARIEALIDEASVGGVVAGLPGPVLIETFNAQKTAALQLSQLKLARGFIARMLANVKNAPG